MENDSVNIARSMYYGLLSSFFAFIDNKNIDNILQNLNILEEYSINNETKNSIQNIKQILQENGNQILKQENTQIFFDPYGGYIAMSASYYLEQRDDGKMRLKMLDYVLKSNFRRDDEKFKENEDHIQFILEFIYNLIKSDFKGIDKNNKNIVFNVFKDILNPFVDDFIVSLFEHKNAFVYKEVAVILQSFMEFERMYLDIQRPNKDAKAVTLQIEKKHTKPFTKKIQRNLDEIKL